MKHDYTNPEIWDIIWTRPYENYKKHHQDFWKLIREKASGKTLDMACGAANYWVGLSIKLYGCDFSKAAIDEAKKNNPKGKFRVDEIPTHYYDDAGFDTIVVSGLLNYYSDLQPIMGMVLRAGRTGTLVLLTINVIDDFPDRHWDMGLIETTFRPYGEVEVIWKEKVGWFVAIILK